MHHPVGDSAPPPARDATSAWSAVPTRVRAEGAKVGSGPAASGFRVRFGLGAPPGAAGARRAGWRPPPAAVPRAPRPPTPRPPTPTPGPAAVSARGPRSHLPLLRRRRRWALRPWSPAGGTGAGEAGAAAGPCPGRWGARACPLWVGGGVMEDRAAAARFLWFKAGRRGGQTARAAGTRRDGLPRAIRWSLPRGCSEPRRLGPQCIPFGDTHFALPACKEDWCHRFPRLGPPHSQPFLQGRWMDPWRKAK